MKCATCNNDECKGCQSYSSRLWNAATYVGLDKISGESYKKAGVMGSGLITIASGAAIATVSTGLLPITFGTMVTGAGYSLMIVPLMKFYSGEPLKKEELIKDVALGATIGVVTGPFGMY